MLTQMRTCAHKRAQMMPRAGPSIFVSTSIWRENLTRQQAFTQPLRNMQRSALRNAHNAHTAERWAIGLGGTLGGMLLGALCCTWLVRRKPHLLVGERVGMKADLLQSVQGQ